MDALSCYPHMPTWELAQLPPARRVVPVVLLDAFEDTGDRTHHDLERLLQRVVWLMPNAFFVITDRSRFQRADEGPQGQLDRTGRVAWPCRPRRPPATHRLGTGEAGAADPDR
ncbi:hypothetical protein ABT218_23835 [Streptomyces sp. NPDC001455]|uniref:hypothetical protein n=1 Tax=Streptomyces sp. NPDC001455 TaxID=3154518 RepID=UPI00332D58E2